MDLSEHHLNFSKKLVSIAGAVLLIHALLIYMLINGMGQQTISIIKESRIQATLIEEIKPAALPTPVVSSSPPKRVISPKPFAPNPATVTLQTPSTNTIPAETNEPSTQSDRDIEAVAVKESTKGPLVTSAIVDFDTCVKPDYPRNSLLNEEEGTVRIQFLIGLDGRVADSKIAKSSGFRALDAAAKKALSLCKFKPGAIDGKPQQSWTAVNYIWKLPD